jgi:amino acid adenylation domain-containing protein
MDVAIGNAVGHAKLDLHIELDERPEGHIAGRLIYNSDIFDPPTAQRIGGHLLTLLQGIEDQPTMRVSDLPLVTAQELHRQVVEWNETAVPYPDQTPLHELVRAQAERTPKAIAAQCSGAVLTYRQLESRSNRLAELLRAAGVVRGDLVAICVPRSLNMLVGMLGILKAGAAYVPLDPSYPSERLAFMVQDSGARVVLSEAGLPAGLTGLDITSVHIADIDGGGAETAVAPMDPATADDLAYVIYTSGSTGKPKGVRIPHRAVVNLIWSMKRVPGLTSRDRVLAVTTYSFDIAVVELWLPLVCGAQIELAPTDVAADGRRLVKLYEQSQPTFMQATPATWRMLIESGWKGSPRLVALAGGEAVDRHLADQVLEHCGHLWNVYGPTETTVWSTLGPIERGEGITIGRPLANTSVYILDSQRRPQPTGAAGEIFIGGHGVARGYLNRPELTAERFVPDPFRPGTTMYRTGDLGRFREEGVIEHLGRLDQQVKVRGYRIETGEVESALLGDPGVASAAVVARKDRFGDQQLVAYFVPAGGDAPDISRLRTVLRRSLPDFMVPSLFVKLASLPLTPNGKVDRKALPAPDDNRQSGAAETYVAPRTPLEEKIAAIWSGMLGVGRIGVNDDFFDLGGHSLLAVRLLAEIRSALGVEVPVSAFFVGASTVAGLARTIDGDRQPPATELVFNVQPRGSRPPLFFVHSHETSLLTLRHFIGPLGPDQPVIALLPERQEYRFDRTSSVPQMAARLVAVIRDAQPSGPYYIAGHSFGGILAYEIATQLRDVREEVAWVGVLDAGTPAEAGHWLQSRLSPVARLKRLRQLGLRGAPAKVFEVMRRESNDVLVGIGKKLDPLGESQYDWEGAMTLVLRYQPAGTDAPVELFTPAEQLMSSNRRYLGWEDVHKGSLAIFEVPGDHLSMLTEPSVDVLAQLLASRLQSAQARSPVPVH